MELRKSFIHKKYVLRSFIQRTSYGERELARDMEAAIKDNDMHALLQSFSEGARPEYTIDNFGRSCLHLAVEMGQVLGEIKFKKLGCVYKVRQVTRIRSFFFIRSTSWALQGQIIF